MTVNLRLHAPTPRSDEGGFASANGALLVCPETLPQRLLQHLTGTILGEIRFRKLDAPGKFIARKASPAESNQIVGGKSCVRLQDYASHYKFAPLRIGYAEDGYFTNGGMPVDHCFHLSRINVLTAGNNHVL